MLRSVRTCLFALLALYAYSFLPAIAADWPTWRYDAGRTAATPEELPDQLHLQWVRQLPTPRPAWPRSQHKLQFDASYEPVVLGKQIFVPSMVRDNVTAYDTRTGKLLWRLYADGPVRFAPVAYKDKVYFVSDDGHLYCVRAADGSLLWKFRGGPSDRKVIGNDRWVSMWPARGAPVVYQGKIYFAASIWPFMGIFIHALDAETGKVVWTNSGSGSTYIQQQHSSPAFAGVAPQGYLTAVEDKLLVSGGRTVPAVYDRMTGRLLYYHLSSRQFGKDAGGYEVMAADGCFFNGGTMYRLEDGKGLLPVGQGPCDSDTLYCMRDGQLVVVGLPPVEIEETDATGVTTRRPGLRVLWRAALRPAPDKVFLKAGNRLYGARDDGTVMGISLDQKGAAAVSWQVNVEGTPWSMLAADGKLFVVTREGRVYCFGPTTAAPKTYAEHKPKLPAKNDQWTRQAREILKHTAMADGYCLVLGIGSGRLIEELSRQSKLNIIAVDADAGKVRQLREKLYDLADDSDTPRTVTGKEGLPPVKIEWPRKWQVLGAFPEGTPALPQEALKTIPEQWQLGGKTYATQLLETVGNVLDFSYLYGGYGLAPLKPGEKPTVHPRGKAKQDPAAVGRVAYAFARIHCPTAGRLTIGTGADWWMQWYLDGRPIYDTLDTGNEAYPFGVNNHVFSVNVSAGEHVLAVMVKAGSGSWIVISTGGAAFDRKIEKKKEPLPPPRRITVCCGDPFSFELPPYFANLIVSEDLTTVGFDPAKVEAGHIFDGLRPYGGVACFPVGQGDGGALLKWVRRSKLENGQVSLAGGLLVLRRPGPLPGAGKWTHQYADAANSVVSKDERVKSPLGLLWFGGPPNDPVLPRHGHGPSPQVAGGRLFIEGLDMLRAVDVYTGRLLWERDITRIGYYYRHTSHQPGANEIGSNYVSMADGIYVVSPRSCRRLDPATGKTIKEYVLPASENAERPGWGFISVWEDLLVATVSPIKVPLTDEGPAEKPPAVPLESIPGVTVNSDYASASQTLVVMDRHTGELLWSRPARHSFRHNAIVVAAAKVFCIDKMSETKISYLRRRGYEVREKPTLYALDARSGEVVWRKDDNVFGTWLGYSEEHDVLLQAGSASGDRAADEVGQGLAAYKGSDGTVLWKNDEKYRGPCLLHHDTIITQGYSLDLLTGKRLTRKHPLTDQVIPWTFTRNYGCNTVVGSEHLLTFRSAAAGYFDLEHNGGTGNLGGFKSGCTSNLIIADGVLNAPDYTRTCTCSYQNQASLAMIHTPEVEMWTFNDLGAEIAGRIRRVGLNFGAPGDRLSESGTLWLDYPSVGGPSPQVQVALQPTNVMIMSDSKVHGIYAGRMFRYHSSRIVSGDLKWVAASGLDDVTGVAVTLAEGAKDERLYTVRLYFAEVEDMRAGERIFNVSLQGKPVLKDFDIVREAGGANRCAVKEFKGVPVKDSLKVALTPAAAAAPGPVLCGIEIVADGW